MVRKLFGSFLINGLRKNVQEFKNQKSNLKFNPKSQNHNTIKNQIITISLKFSFFKFFIKFYDIIYLKSNIRFYSRLISKGKYVLNIKTWYSKNFENIDYTTLTPKIDLIFEHDELDFLNKVNANKQYISFNRNIYFQKEIFSCILQNVKFKGASALLFKNDFVFIESAYSLRRFLSVSLLDCFLPKIKAKKGFYTSIMHWDILNNHYHFLIDNLPRLYSILKINEPKIYFIVPKYFNKFYLDIIKLFLDKRFEIVTIEPYEIWKIKKFFFASFCSNDQNSFGYIPKIYLDFVKNTIFEKLGIKKIFQKKRVYISRSKARSRRILSEFELFDILEKYGFEIICTEDMSFKEEVELFNSAEIIIAPSGAALANIIFSENLKLIEIFSPNHIIQTYFLLSKVLGFNYYYLIGTNEKENQDFQINKTDLEIKIKEILIN